MAGPSSLAAIIVGEKLSLEGEQCIPPSSLLAQTWLQFQILPPSTASFTKQLYQPAVVAPL